jgi:hypothetical protein
MSPLRGCSFFSQFQWLAPLAELCRPSGANDDRAKPQSRSLPLLKSDIEMNETFQNGTADPATAVNPDAATAEQPQAWAMIENGRYQPRRIKGSCLGRELG